MKKGDFPLLWFHGSCIARLPLMTRPCPPSEGKYPLAERLSRHVLGILERAFGPDHPNVAASLEECALLLRQTNRASEAEQLEARAQAIRAAGPATL